MKEKIVVALSGGVDSSVSALLLKQQGFDVICVFMRNWDNFLENDNNRGCEQEKDWEFAKKVSKQLGLEVHQVNFTKEYWNYIFLNFIEETKKGKTVNPDVFCNKIIKFKFFLDYVIDKFKVNKIATGHYSSIDYFQKKHVLTKALDQNKDQTYFLCQISIDVLNKIIFPLSNLNKKKVREIAKEYNLINHDKKDSTGLCFIGERKFEDFLSNYIPKTEGDVIDIISKEKVGKHQGTSFYTIGKKSNLGIYKNNISYFVVGKDVKKNLLFVSNNYDNESFVFSSWFIVDNFNLLVKDNIFIKIVKKNVDLYVKTRYRQQDEEINITIDNENLLKFKIKPKNPLKHVTPGQFAVIYYKRICLGGGIIIETEFIDEFQKPKFL